MPLFQTKAVEYLPLPQDLELALSGAAAPGLLGTAASAGSSSAAAAGPAVQQLKQQRHPPASHPANHHPNHPPPPPLPPLPPHFSQHPPHPDEYAAHHLHQQYLQQYHSQHDDQAYDAPPLPPNHDLYAGGPVSVGEVVGDSEVHLHMHQHLGHHPPVAVSMHPYASNHPPPSAAHHPPASSGPSAHQHHPPSSASLHQTRRGESNASMEQLDPLNQLLHTQMEVWQVRSTGEIFTNYDDYIARYSFLRKRQFSCAKTGKTGLTYEEALASEQQAIKRVEETFPEVWRLPAMKLIHYSMEKLNSLTESLYDHFATHLFLREFIYINVEGVLAMAQILEAIPPKGKPALEGPFPITDSDVLYRVNLVDNEHNLLTVQDLDGAFPVEYIYPVSQLKRDRQILAKQNFKKFIRDVATREVWIGAPWIVRPEFIKKYEVPDIIPPAAAEVLDERHRKLTGEPKVKPTPKKEKGADGSPASNGKAKGKAAKGDKEKGTKKKGRPPKNVDADGKPIKKPRPSRAKPKPKVLKFPMEDLELLEVAPPQHEGVEGPIPVMPELSHDFGAVSRINTKDLVQVVNFLCVHGKALHMFPFTLHEFVEALSHRDAEHPSALLSEAFACLLNTTCREYGNRVEDPENPPVNAETSHASAQEWSTYTAETQEAMAEYIQVYSKFTEDERVAIDQWWKWEPARWARAGVGKHGPDVNRLKAWEIVLAGVVRDVAQVDVLPNKWSLLVRLLGKGHDASRSHGDEHIDIDSHSVDTGENTPVDMMDIDPDDDKPFGLRKRRRKTDTDDDADFAPPVEELAPVKTGGGSRAKRGGGRGNSRQAPAKSAKARGGSATAFGGRKKRSKVKLAFDQLTEDTEHGFARGLSCNDRLELLAFLVQRVVGISDVIRNHVEESLEKATELRREKREIARERKELMLIKADITKAEKDEDDAHAQVNGGQQEDKGAEAAEGSQASDLPDDETPSPSRETKSKSTSRRSQSHDGEKSSNHSSDSESGSGGDDSVSSTSSTRSSKPRARKVKKEADRERSASGSNSDNSEDDEEKPAPRRSRKNIVPDVKNEASGDDEASSDESEAEQQTSVAVPMDIDVAATGSGSEAESEPEPTTKRRRTSTRSMSGTQPASSSSPAATTARAQKLQAARQKQSQRESLSKASIAAAKEAQKVARERAALRKTTDAKLDALAARDRDIDDHIATCLAASRIKPVGTDRYHNRYWYFDPAVRLPPASSADPKTHPDPPTLPIHARLYVEQTGLDPVVVAAAEEASSPASPAVAPLSAAERDVVMQGLTDGIWSYLADPEQLDALIASLDKRGERELHLADALNKLVKPRWSEGPSAASGPYVNWFAN
ncbi:hypothetical protein HDU88_002686 [Geranomyces variabilis]|nr:hypothetical protein HDU88_002686 [Geranomyces variabilis]